MSHSFRLTLLPLLIVGLGACTKKIADDETSIGVDTSSEIAQQLGDLMSQVDESPSGTGSFAQSIRAEEKLFARLAPGSIVSPSPLQQVLFPSATAANCADEAFQCASGTATRTFADCSLGTATVSGSVTLSFRSNSTPKSTCNLNAVQDNVRRVPDYTITGLRGASLTVTNEVGASGLQITQITNTGTKIYAVDNDGTRRVLKIGDTVVYDTTTKIENNADPTNLQPMGVRGETRNGRKVVDGQLVITNNLTGGSCTIRNEELVWSSASCRCATSGTLEGECTDGKTLGLTITGCGEADITVNGETKSVTLDRCSM